MISEKQLAANQSNAEKSTGPTSTEGKAVCSMNGLRDGLFAATLILPREDRAAFDRLRDKLLAAYLPEGPREQDLVDQLAAVKWKMLRAELIEAGTLIENGDKPASECAGPYDRITRVQGRLRRDLFRLYNDLDRIRAERRQGGAKAVEASAAPARARAPERVAQKGDEQWATAEEMLRPDPKKEFKLPKYYEVLWTPVQGEPPKPFARLYKGQSVKEWPADDPPPAECVHMQPGQPARIEPYFDPLRPKPPKEDDK